MKYVGFIVALILGLAIYGLPLLGCLMFLLVGLGVSVEASFPCGALLVVVLAFGIGFKIFFVDP